MTRHTVNRMILSFALLVTLGIIFCTPKYVLTRAEVSGVPLTAWTKTYGGTGWDQAYSGVQTPEGGYVITGRTSSSGAGGFDILLIKTDAGGNIIWSKTFGGASDDWPGCVIQTSDGGYAIAGGTRSAGAGDYDFWLIKTDAQGNMKWNRTYGGVVWDFAHSIIQTGDGGYAIAGVKNLAGINAGDFWLIKTDANGYSTWDFTYGQGAIDEAMDVTQTSDGGYALAGAGFANLVKVNANGGLQWTKYYGFIAKSLVETDDGGYVLTGYDYEFDSDDYNMWLLKADANGNVEWNKTIGGTDWDYAQSVTKTSDEGYAVAGYSRSYGSGLYDFWLIKTDNSGNVQWNQTYGGGSVDQAFSIIETSDRGYLMIGKTDSFGAGSSDFWLVKLAGPWNYDVTGDGYCGIDDIVVVAEHFSTYPGHPNWNPIYDINADNYVGIDDIVLVAEHFGESI